MAGGRLGGLAFDDRALLARPRWLAAGDRERKREDG